MRAGLSSAGALALGPTFLERAFAAGPVTVGDGPYGPLGPFDSNGIALPEGFSSREIARGSVEVAGSSPPYTWHLVTDGQATFPTLRGGSGPDGGWILVANSEFPVPGGGGVSAIRFADDGRVLDAYRVLSGTSFNCAGGPTPWGTWLSCEEHEEGMVHECEPTRLNAGVARPAMGVFAHEAACVDPAGERLYLTEDEPDGCLYRFTPDEYPDLTEGVLEVAVGESPGAGAPGVLTWQEVPNPAGGAIQPTRTQLDGAAHFDGGEGLWHDDGIVYFTTKGDNRVWNYRIADSRLDVLYDAAAVGPDAPLSGVDNITVSPSGDLFVCEDGADHDICMVTPNFEVTRFLKLDPVMHAGPTPPNPFAGNETVGVIFTPDGSRMYFGAQRSFPAGELPLGVVYEIRGPFRRPAPPPGPGDLRPPGVALRVARRRPIRKLVANGLVAKLEIDEPSGVKATLRVPVKGRDGKRRSRLVASGETTVAVAGRVALRLKPAKGARALRRRRRAVAAKLTVRVVDTSGNRTVRRRTVLLEPAAKS